MYENTIYKNDTNTLCSFLG